MHFNISLSLISAGNVMQAGVPMTGFGGIVHTQVHGKTLHANRAISRRNISTASSLHASIISEIHCSPYAGHTGMNRSLVLIVGISIGQTCRLT